MHVFVYFILVKACISLMTNEASDTFGNLHTLFFECSSSLPIFLLGFLAFFFFYSIVVGFFVHSTYEFFKSVYL